MALRYIEGNIFDSRAQATTCPVNLVGAMGKGLALAFRQKYPTLPGVYLDLLGNNMLLMGRPFSVGLNGVPQDIILFPTKQHWRNPSELDWIENGIKYMISRLETHAWKYESIAVPALGCGEGGLKWEDVKPLMDLYFDTVECRFEVYILGE